MAKYNQLLRIEELLGDAACLRRAGGLPALGGWRHVTAPAGPRSPAPERARFTSRAAVLAVVICAIALSLAYPVREYIGQRRQIDQLEAQRQTIEVQLGKLEAEHRRLSRPGLRRAAGAGPAAYVLPGQTCYVVLPGRHFAARPSRPRAGRAVVRAHVAFGPRG